VTFDCWATLLYEANTHNAPEARVRIVSELTGADPHDARAALRASWRRHQILWHHGVAFTAVDMTKLALDTLGVKLDEARGRALVTALETEALSHDVLALDGARDVLAALAQAGVRRALICDTGFTPGRVVRQLLERVGLLEFLEATAFSDEVGVPKPNPEIFRAVLATLDVAPLAAVHVGDLRRSDVAGAKKVEMGSIRLRALHDDADEGPGRQAGVIDCTAAGCAPPCERPEADAVADSHRHLAELLGFG
jgi:putative hydrolase of the HAD superfamily